MVSNGLVQDLELQTSFVFGSVRNPPFVQLNNEYPIYVQLNNIQIQ